MTILFPVHQPPRSTLFPMSTKVITELRELKADIYKLGRSLDGGSFAGPRAVLPSTEAPCYERAARSPRCSLHNSQDSTKNRKSACRSGNDRKASSVPPKPPPPSPLPFSIPCRPSTTSLKQAVRSDYAGASDVSQLVQRVEKSARAVSREKEDVMEVCAVGVESRGTVTVLLTWQACSRDAAPGLAGI